MNRDSRIIDCLPPRKGDPVETSFRLPWWAWLAIGLAIALALILH